LRVATALREYHQASEALGRELAEQEKLREAIRAREEESGGWERELTELEDWLGRLEEAITGQEGVLGEARRGVATEQTRVEHELAAEEQLQQERSRARDRVVTLGREVEQLAAGRDAMLAQRDQAAALLEQQHEAVARLAEAVEETEARLASLRQEI